MGREAKDPLGVRSGIVCTVYRRCWRSRQPPRSAPAHYFNLGTVRKELAPGRPGTGLHYLEDRLRAAFRYPAAVYRRYVVGVGAQIVAFFLIQEAFGEAAAYAYLLFCVTLVTLLMAKHLFSQLREPWRFSIDGEVLHAEWLGHRATISLKDAQIGPEGRDVGWNESWVEITAPGTSFRVFSSLQGFDELISLLNAGPKSTPS